jgi:HEAT repeat protein
LDSKITSHPIQAASLIKQNKPGDQKQVGNLPSKSPEPFSNYLKKSYRENLATLPLILTNEAFPIGSFFTQLSIVSQVSQEKKEEELRRRDPHLVEKDSLREVYMRLYEVEKPIEIKTLFDNRDGKPVKKVLLLGRAGIGKSTLCQKIAYDWASDVLFKDKFVAIYRLQLRELNGWITENPLLSNQSSDQWLSFAIAWLCYQGAYQEKIQEELQKNPEKILLLFDGWDEASTELAQALKRCLQKDKVHCLLTSRPGVTNEIQGSLDLTVENMGFTHKQIEIYAEKFFSHTKCESLQLFLENLRGSSDIFTIAHIPIQLQILCALWQQGEKEFPNNLISMFSKITERLFDWEQGKLKGPISEFKKQLLYEVIGEIAKQGLDSKQLIISKGLIENVLMNEKFKAIHKKDLIGSGFLKGCGREGEMYFIHLTYQEYSIAKYVSTLSKKEQCNFVQNYRYKPQFHLVMRMLAGCLWEKWDRNIQELEVFFVWLYSGHVDMIGSYQVELVLACLEECRCDELEDVIWKKYKIADFVDDVLQSEKTRDCLIQFMAVSRRAFEQVRNNVQNEMEQLKWFLVNLEMFIKREYLLTLDWFFLALSNFNKDSRYSLSRHVGVVAAHASQESISEILEWLKIALNNDSLNVRIFAVEALGVVAAHASQESIPKILEWLLMALNSGSADVRIYAAEALGKVAAHASQESIPKILKCLIIAISNINLHVRISAEKAFNKVAAHASQDSISKILEWLKIVLSDENSNVRQAAVNVVAQVAAHASRDSISEILDWLLMALNNGSADVHKIAEKALAKVATHANQESIPKILEWFKKVLSNKNQDGYAAVQYASTQVGMNVSTEPFMMLSRHEDENNLVRDSLLLEPLRIRYDNNYFVRDSLLPKSLHIGNHTDAESLLSIFISPPLDCSARKLHIFEQFISECIPLYITETDIGSFIQTNETDKLTFKITQKDSILQLCHGKGKTHSEKNCLVS